MKLTNIVYSALSLFALAGALLPGGASAKELSAPVEAKGIDCNRAVLSYLPPQSENDKGKFVAKFLAHGVPSYNAYNGEVGDRRIDNTNTDLRTVAGNLASWLIVVDISDPSGRSETIIESAAIATRLLTLMSQDSNARVLALAGGHKEVADSRIPEVKAIMNEGGKLNGLPIYERTKKGFSFGQDVYGAIIGAVATRQDIQANNTNLWIGVSRMLKDDMPECSSNGYVNMPRGIILISDGVDESPSSEADFNTLVKMAKEMNVPIHTIAVPFKDAGKARGKNSSTERHKGFATLQRLALDTNGGYLSYADIEGATSTSLPAINKLDALLRRTSATVLQLTTDEAELPAGKSLKLYLNVGREAVAYMEVHQEDVGIIIGDCALHNLYLLKSKFGSEDREINARIKLAMAALVKTRLMPLTNREALAKFTYADRDFVRRVTEVLMHVDKHNALKKQADIVESIVNCIVDTTAALPEPPADSPDIVVNNTNNNSNPSYSSSSSSDAPESGLEDWVWWAIAAGGGSLMVIILVLIIRSMNGDGGRDRRYREPEDDWNEVEEETLATLVDANQPSNCWNVTKTSVTVGRSSAADICVDGTHVSGIHFTLFRDSAGQWMIKDSNSTNGTSLNGSRLTTSSPINSGDTIEAADVKLTFRIR